MHGYRANLNKTKGTERKAHLVDDVPQSLGSCVRRKREGAPLAPAAYHIGDIIIETIHPLARQREAHVVVLQPVLDLVITIETPTQILFADIRHFIGILFRSATQESHFDSGSSIHKMLHRILCSVPGVYSFSATQDRTATPRIVPNADRLSLS
jgi:hypothetical protein